MATEFIPVLLGSDINAYSMARAFHEAYGIQSVVYGMYPASVCAGSTIIDYRVRAHNDRADTVLENVTEVAGAHPDKTILVLGCGDNYLNAISANLPRFPGNVVAPYVPLDLLETLIHKERFYQLCEQYGIDYPDTVVYHKGMGHDFTLPFDGPFVVKPAESDTYWKHPFPTQKKAYVLQTRAEVDQVIDDIYGAGYEDSLILQDFIPGDDSFMRVVTNYSGADGKVNDVSFYVRRGEIVGIAGLVGAGKSELCKTIFGAYERTAGTVRLNGEEVKIKNPSHAVKSRIALVPEERRKEGVLVNENVSFNLSAASLSRFCKASFILKNKVDSNARQYVNDLGIATPSIKQYVKNLSGGNQQKVAVGKWMAADCDVYIFDEPTKGVDVGAKQDIFRLINDITKRGSSVIYASCENSELLSITDRIYVLYDGRIMAELETAKTNEDEIMHYAVGSTTKYA